MSNIELSERNVLCFNLFFLIDLFYVINLLILFNKNSDFFWFGKKPQGWQLCSCFVKYTNEKNFAFIYFIGIYFRSFFSTELLTFSIPRNQLIEMMEFIKCWFKCKNCSNFLNVVCLKMRIIFFLIRIIREGFGIITSVYF